ncbi:PDZ domain-containing protein [Rhizobium leguminosarum]|uniref:PDZ domain-containing protein n=1 Tax=Rhizobium leguminosarum TaxID=384 RepID=UPI0021B0BE44|nr:PDZ domain-containing protein [Rhizobium leguminosarum]
MAVGERSVAAQAGLQPDDVIVALDRQPVTDVGQLLAYPCRSMRALSSPSLGTGPPLRGRRPAGPVAAPQTAVVSPLKSQCRSRADEDQRPNSPAVPEMVSSKSEGVVMKDIHAPHPPTHHEFSGLFIDSKSSTT